MIERIYLNGFMASGKSTLGPILANTLGWEFADIDRLLEKAENMRVTEIFDKKGEEYFRMREAEVLREIGRTTRIVISLGGGTAINEENLKFIMETGFVIFLRASSKSIFARLRRKLDRPMFRDLVLRGAPEEEFMERIQSMLHERMPYYLKSHLTLDTDSLRIGDTIDKIQRLVRRHC